MDTSRQEYDKIIKKLDQFIEMLNSERSNKKTLSTEINNYIEKYSAICTTYIGDNQETLLMIVARKNINDITKLVTKKILDFKLEALHLSDNQGNTPLLHAAMANNTEFFKIIANFVSSDEINIKNNANKTTFMLAAQHGSKDFLKKMLELKCTISKEEQEQSLLLASECGHTAVVEFLLSKDVNIDINNSDGDTPLIIANKKGHYEVVSLLRKQYPISRIFFTLLCIVRWIGEFSQSCQNESIKEILNFLSRSIETVICGLHKLSNTQLSFTVPLFKKIDQWRPHPIEDWLITPEREKEGIKLFYGERDHHSGSSSEVHQRINNDATTEMENNQHQTQRPGTLSTQDQVEAYQESSNVQNGGNTYQAAALEIEKRKHALLIAKAEFAEATPEQKQDKEKLVGLCEGAVLRAEAALGEIRIKREEEELYRSPVRPEIPPTCFNSAPLRRRRTSRSGSIGLSTHTSTPQGIRRQKSRKINGSNHLSGGNRSLAHTSPFRGVERVPPLPLSTLNSQVAQAVSFTPGEPHSSSASSSQERPRNQQHPRLSFPRL